MKEHIKKRIVKELIEEVVGLDDREIELIGHQYISIKENMNMIHKGLNKDYKPVGYTVDSFSDDYKIIGEYSSEDKYFEPTGKAGALVYKKIDKDINHAISQASGIQLEKIYLISNNEIPNSFRKKFNSTNIARQHGDIVVFVDAMELAKGIYAQSIESSNVAEFYKQFFPYYSLNLDNFEYFGKLPNICDNYVRDVGIQNQISNSLSVEKVCVLHGLSGSGKTHAVIDYVQNNTLNYESYIWLSGKDWPENTPLSSIKRTRGGAPINAAGLFNATKSILVIDSLERIVNQTMFAEFEKGFALGGVVIITSQIANSASEIYVRIPHLSEKVAALILGEDITSLSCKAKQFVSKCRFSPLILAMTKALADKNLGEKEDIYSEIIDDPELVNDEKGSSIMKKILNRLEPKSLEALKKISNSGQNSHDIKFLKKYIGILQFNSLHELSLVVPTNALGIFRIHDLVSIAVRVGVKSSDISMAVEGYVSQENGGMTPSVLRQVHLCFQQMYTEHLKRGDREPDWLHYSLLQCETDKKQSLYGNLNNQQLNTNITLPSLMCIIDAKEIHSYTIADQKERKLYYRECVKEYSEALITASSEEIRAELLHHKGKSLRRLGELSGAIEVFEELLELRPEWHATHGQIAHIGTQWSADKSAKSKGEKSLHILIDDMLSDSSSVPLRVSLAAIAKLRSYYSLKQGLNSNKESVRKLADIVAMSALEGLDQFYEGFVSFTSCFGYEHSELSLSITEAIPEIAVISPKSIEKRQWISACEALTNTAIEAMRVDKTNIANRLCNASLNFANEFKNTEKLRPFDARCIGKAYTTAKQPALAIEAIKKVDDKDIDHWVLYELTKAYQKLGDHPLALLSAKKCFNKAVKNKSGLERVSIYHEILSMSYENCGINTKAKRHLQRAVKKCSNDKYKATLDKRLIEFMSKFDFNFAANL
jgi:tetratricopeptide (TPR) repeat protein